MANSILEGFALARAVLASDIPGNRALVEDDVTGLIFSDGRSLEAAALRLATDGALRTRLGAAGRALVERRYPPSREVDVGIATGGRAGAPLAGNAWHVTPAGSAQTGDEVPTSATIATTTLPNSLRAMTPSSNVLKTGA